MKTALRLTVAAFVLAALNLSAAQFEEVTTSAGLADEQGYCLSAAWGDYDNDGYSDLYIAIGGSGTHMNALYRNNHDGTFIRKTGAEVGPIASDNHDSFGCLWIDFNNDGHLDMLVLNGGWSLSRHDLYLNQGDGTFRGASAGSLTSASCASSWGACADYDGDGFVDIYVPQQPSGSGSYYGRLYHATPSGSFAPTNLLTVSYGNDGVWGDYNNDGKPDLFACNYTSPSSLWRNDGQGKFTKMTNGLPASGGTLHAAWADYDNDGNLDIALCGTGGTQLYRNDGQGAFVRVTNFTAAVWGTPGWADCDNDGHLDLLVVGGQDSPRPAHLYHNNGDGTFSDASEPLTETAANWLTAPWGDYDNDGFMDVLLTHQYGANQLYHNLGNANHWIKFRLVGTVSNRDAIGAKVRVGATIAGQTVWQLREVNGGYAQQNDLRPDFGLGDATNADLVRIEWPSGIVQTLTNVAPQRILTVTEPSHLVAQGPGQLQVQSWKGMAFELQASTNLVEWTSLGTATNLDGTLKFNEPEVAGHDKRFYRAVAK
jgi:enediyne biosynthesis protein E4